LVRWSRKTVVKAKEKPASYIEAEKGRQKERRTTTTDEGREKRVINSNPLSPPLASLPSGFFADFIRFSPRGDETDMTNRRYTVR